MTMIQLFPKARGRAEQGRWPLFWMTLLPLVHRLHCRRLRRTLSHWSTSARLTANWSEGHIRLVTHIVLRKSGNYNLLDKNKTPALNYVINSNQFVCYHYWILLNLLLEVTSMEGVLYFRQSTFHFHILAKSSYFISHICSDSFLDLYPKVPINHCC